MSFLLYRNSLSYNDNVGSLRSTITLGYIESNGLAFLQSLEAISNDADADPKWVAFNAEKAAEWPEA